MKHKKVVENVSGEVFKILFCWTFWFKCKLPKFVFEYSAGANVLNYTPPVEILHPIKLYASVLSTQGAAVFFQS